MYKKENVIISRPVLATIHVQVSSHKSVVDVIFGTQKLKDLPFRPTNDPPISGGHFDDYVYEHTANMLGDTAHNLENCLSCNRSKALDYNGSRNEEKKSQIKKHDTTSAHKSKMKVLHDIRARVKKSTRRKNVWLFEKSFKRSRGGLKRKRKLWNKKHDITFRKRSKMKWLGGWKLEVMKSFRKDYAWLFKTRFKCSHGRRQGRRLGLHKIKEGMPFDPGIRQVTYDPP